MTSSSFLSGLLKTLLITFSLPSCICNSTVPVPILLQAYAKWIFHAVGSMPRSGYCMSLANFLIASSWIYFHAKFVLDSVNSCNGAVIFFFFHEPFIVGANSQESSYFVFIPNTNLSTSKFISWFFFLYIFRRHPICLFFGELDVMFIVFTFGRFRTSSSVDFSIITNIVINRIYGQYIVCLLYQVPWYQ